MQTNKRKIIGNGFLTPFDYKHPEVNTLMAEAGRIVLRLHTLQSLMWLALNTGEKEIARKWAKMEREESINLEHLRQRISKIRT